ncbi:MAG: AAA family ATPase [Phycisphaerae bacterium]|jgi:MoxR-like ATPase
MDSPRDESEQAPMPPAPEAGDDVQATERLRTAYAAVRQELARVIVGQEEVLEQLLIALFARGHVILEGVPGLAKTLMISSLARCLDLGFHRIQFTPDLMPSDITGTEVIQEDRRTGQRSFRFLPGPVFTNVLLADEINRTPPKTQAALLEAMQERQVSAGGVRHALDPPFFVLATQNPIEQEGTYPLPEAQQDRFMFKVLVEYPGYEDEYLIAERAAAAEPPELRAVLTRPEILHLQDVVRRVPVAPSVIHYALTIVRRTRPSAAAGRNGEQSGGDGGDGGDGGKDFERSSATPLIDRLVTFGAGPRAVQFLLLGAKARAVLHGRNHVAVEDVRALAPPVLRHRLITNYAADAEGYDTDRIIGHVLASLPADGLDAAGQSALRRVLQQG